MTSTYDSEEMVDMNLGTTSGCYKFSFEEEFKILGYAMNRQGKSHDDIEERLHSASKTFWKAILIYKSEDVPWKVKCQRLDDHVCAVFTYGSENWSWTTNTLDRIKGWENKTMLRPFRIKRHKEGTLVDYYTRTCNMARKIWMRMGLPFLCERIAESTWRAMGWACVEKSNAVNYSLKKGLQMEKDEMMARTANRNDRRECENHT